MKLSEDLNQLKANPSIEVKQKITDKISNYYSSEVFSENEKMIALDVMRLLAKDAEMRVRRTLARNLSTCGDVPSDLILTLASDIEDVSVPILENSPILSQENLIEIVKTTKRLACIIAVARRSDVSASLADALVDTKTEEVVKALMENKNADVNEDILHKTIENYSKNGIILETIVDRAGLPIDVVQKIMSMVGEDLKKKLVNKYKISSDFASRIIKQAQEDSVLEFIHTQFDADKVSDFLDQLEKVQKITPSVLLRGLCQGELLFFELGLAKLTDMKKEEVHNIIFNEGVTSFSALYKKANMPKGAFEPVNIIIRFFMQELKVNSNIDRKSLINRVIAKIIDGGYDEKVNMMKYFIVLLKSKNNGLEELINDNDNDDKIVATA